MLYQKQLYRHDPENGIYGDCVRTALACLLDLPVEDVPHYIENQVIQLNAWLRERGMTLICLPSVGGSIVEHLLDTLGTCVPNTHYMLCGTSKTGVNHEVVCYNGEIIHDPSLDESGIVGPCDDGFYWITFIGKLV